MQQISGERLQDHWSSGKMFSSGLIVSGHEYLCATSQKCHFTCIILFTWIIVNLQTVTFPLGSMGKMITNVLLKFLLTFIFEIYNE